MTKTIRTSNYLVIVLSSLLLGCVNSLPELPMDIKNTPDPVPTQVSAVAAPVAVLSPVLNSDVTYEEQLIDIRSNFPLDLIANDLVNALSFITGMGPEETSIYAPTSGSVFDNLVITSMQQQGYSFDGRRSRTSSRQLTTSFLETNRETQPSEITAIMAINRVLIRRTYLVQTDSVEPKGSYTIRGIKPGLVDSNEQVRTL